MAENHDSAFDEASDRRRGNSDIVQRLEEVERDVQAVKQEVGGLRTTVSGFDTRMRAVEEGFSGVRADIKRYSAELHANTRLTEDIHGVAADVQTFIRDPKTIERVTELITTWGEVKTVWKFCKEFRKQTYVTMKWILAAMATLGAIIAAFTAPSWTEAVVRIVKAYFSL